MSISASYPNLRPTLLLDFANSGRLDPRVTFTRASTATYFDETGVLQSAAIDVPRFDYDPATLAARGFLIEEQRTNLLTYSEEFDNAAWGPAAGTVTANATTAPSGTTTADRGVTSGVDFQAIQGATITSGATVTGSVFLKADGIDQVEIVLLAANNTTPYARATFNVLTGVISVAVTTANGGTNASASITAINNGWYRCVVTVTYPATTSAGMRINAPGATGGIFLWGAQFEAGAFPTSYIPTTTTALTRSADVASVNTLSPWYNATETTLYTEFNTNIPNTVVSSRTIAGFDDGTANNRFSNFYNTSPAIVAAAQTIAGVASLGSGLVAATGLTLSNVQKQATRFQAGSYASSANGAAAATDSFASAPPTVNTLRIGIRPGGSQGNMWLRRVTVYPRGLSDAELQAITT